jgi:stage V sporulation protein B
VFFVSVLSVVRGYYQGKGNMYPTAATEIMEQVIKVGIGTLFAWLNRGETQNAVAAAIVAVTISEGATSLFAIFLYLKRKREVTPLFKVRQIGYNDILKYTLPLTLTALALPLSQLAESIVIVNILRGEIDNATAIYGIYSGCAVTIINLPVSLCYGLAAASVPKISPLAQSGNIKSAIKLSKKCLWLTFAISLPCAVALYLFSPLAAKIIFSSLKVDEKTLLINLVRIMAVNAISLSLMQTSSAVLTSLGKPIYATVSGWITAILRVCLSAVLIKFTNLSIIGAAISANCCYLVAVLLNFWYIAYVNKKWSKAYEDNIDRFGDGGKRFNSVGKMRT